MKFEWNLRKARLNEQQHGVSFATATEVFADPRLILAEDAAHSASEHRYFAFGHVRGGILTVRFTVRGENVRIIGAGYWRRGKIFYEQANRL